eukprot:TRINITY_DN11856_c0_g1_i3.p3 TRINITY_DN11856_c0_g1~~TRINITY_DN11856_c0_g1_i3.p3  ORF type:complete len:137 (+),score=2.80 TRINITY_DN11856_c0_g1_i3:781-1191(+)
MCSHVVFQSSLLCKGLLTLSALMKLLVGMHLYVIGETRVGLEGCPTVRARKRALLVLLHMGLQVLLVAKAVGADRALEAWRIVFLAMALEKLWAGKTLFAVGAFEWSRGGVHDAMFLQSGRARKPEPHVLCVDTTA